MIGLAFPVQGDGGFRELRQPDRHVDVGPGVVDGPSAALAARVVAEGHAAEIEAAVEALRRRQPDERAAAPELPRARSGGRRQRRPEDEGRDDTGAARPGTHSIIWAAFGPATR